MNLSRNGCGVRAGIKACSLAICFLASAPFVFAQAPPVPPGGTVVAAGLEGPRGLTIGPDGLLYFADAGWAGRRRYRKTVRTCPRQSARTMGA
jgi:hypothetical protein